MASKDSDGNPRCIYLLTGCSHLTNAGPSKLQLNQSKFKILFDNLSKTMSEAVCIDSNGDYSYTWPEIKSMLVVLGFYLKKQLFCCSNQMILDSISLDARGNQNGRELAINHNLNGTATFNGSQQSDTKDKRNTAQCSEQLDLSHFNTIFKKSLTTLTTMTEGVCPDRHDGDFYTWKEVKSTLDVLGLILVKNLFCIKNDILCSIRHHAPVSDNRGDLANSKNLTLSLLKGIVKHIGGQQDGNLWDITVNCAMAGFSKHLDQPHFGTTSQSLNTSSISKDLLSYIVESATSDYSKQLDQPHFGTTSQSLNTSSISKDLLSYIVEGATSDSSKHLDQPHFGTTSQSLNTSSISKDLSSYIVEGAISDSSNQLDQPHFGTTSQSLNTSSISKDLLSYIVEGATSDSSNQLDQPHFGTTSQSLNTSSISKDLSSYIVEGATSDSSNQLDQPHFGTTLQSLNTSSISKDLSSYIVEGATSDSSNQLDQPHFGTTLQSLNTSSISKDLLSYIVEGATSDSSNQLDQPHFGTTLQSLNTSSISKDLSSYIVEGATSDSSNHLDQPHFGTTLQSLNTSSISKDLPSYIVEGAISDSSKQLDQPHFGTTLQSLNTSSISKDLLSYIVESATSDSSKQLDQPHFGTTSQSLNTSSISKDLPSDIVEGATAGQLSDAAIDNNSNDIRSGTNATQRNRNESPGKGSYLQNCRIKNNKLPDMPDICHIFKPSEDGNSEHSEDDNSEHSEDGNSEHSEDGNSEHSEDGNSEHSEDGNSEHSEDGNSEHSEDGNSEHSEDGNSESSEDGNSEHSEDGNSEHSEDGNSEHSEDGNSEHSEDGNSEHSEDGNSEHSEDGNSESSEDDIRLGINAMQQNRNESPGKESHLQNRCITDNKLKDIIDSGDQIDSDFDLSEESDNESQLQTLTDPNYLLSAKKYGIGNGKNNGNEDGSVRSTMKRPVQNDVPVGDESKDSDNSSQSSLSSSHSDKRPASKRIRVASSSSSEDKDNLMDHSINSEKIIDIDKFCKLLKGKNVVSCDLDPVILDTDADSEQVLVQVDKGLLKYLKPHQVEGVKFLYDNTIGSVEQLKKGYAGSGCILAHSMGLGKTLQIVTLLHTVLTNEHLRGRIQRILVIVPLIVASNWIQEFEKWIPQCENDTPITIYASIDTKTVEERVALCERWYLKGGVMIFTTNLFTLLVNEWKDKNDNRLEQHQSVLQCLADLGPDMVIIDEGHQIKNDKSKFHQALSQIRTARRVILSGTPLQNNLSEYFTMVDFVKRGHLGNKSEFKNRFEDRIVGGQHIDSSHYEIDLMKKRVYVLHKVLEDCIHRRDYNVLVPYLKSKSEQVLCLKLTQTQTNLYRHYLDNLADKSNRNFLSDFSNLHCIWSHPVLLSEKDETQTDPATGEPWWRQFMLPQIYDIELSAKFIMMISILERCQKLNDKILIFSKSLLNLNLIENILKIKMKEFRKSYEGDQKSYDNVRRHNDGVCHYWHPDIDYFRIDGKVKSESRSSVIDQFNDPQNQRARLMLVSTRAGGVGINLVGANRCIIFDVSWNPSHDLQAIYRIFRFGQKKRVYVYRFVASGTMESKVYKRQIVKESLSRRVIDQHQIRPQYSASELGELYRFTDPDDKRQELKVPKNDPLLAGIMESHGQWIISNHQQDSLLENDPEQALTEAERQLAMDQYRREIVQMQYSDSE